MKERSQHPKIRPQHLERKAIVYLRQSSERQVRENQESQRLQYALKDRARQLGWKNVEMIDMDLGRSATMGAAPRLGFDQVIAAVARGEVGIVMSREVSRLSRRDKDWCQLLEVCQLFGTLIGDAEQIYDLNKRDRFRWIGTARQLIRLLVRNLRSIRSHPEFLAGARPAATLCWCACPGKKLDASETHRCIRERQIG